jgi:hypothetical protein
MDDDREPDHEQIQDDGEGDVLAGGEFTEEMSESEADADQTSGATEGAPGEGEGRLGGG